MSDFTSRMIPLKASLRTCVFEVTAEVLYNINSLRRTHHAEATPEVWRKGVPRVTITEANLNVISIQFNVGNETRDLSVWFDYTDHDDADARYNIYLHIGDWGMAAEIFNTTEKAIHKLVGELTGV